MVITGDNTSILICCNNNTEDTERYKMQNLCTDLTSAAAAAAAAGRQTDTHRQPQACHITTKQSKNITRQFQQKNTNQMLPCHRIKI